MVSNNYRTFNGNPPTMMLLSTKNDYKQKKEKEIKNELKPLGTSRLS